MDTTHSSAHADAVELNEDQKKKKEEQKQADEKADSTVMPVQPVNQPRQKPSSN